MPTANELYAESTCFLCYGITQAQALKLALLVRQALASNPAADVTPQGLLAQSECYNCYTEGNLFDLFELALLTIISEAGGGGACANLSGADSPLNVVTPDFVGQVYVQADGTIWQAGSLLSSSWTVIYASFVSIDGTPVGSTVVGFYMEGSELQWGGNTLTLGANTLGFLSLSNTFADFNTQLATVEAPNLTTLGAVGLAVNTKLRIGVQDGQTLYGLTSLNFPVLTTIAGGGNAIIITAPIIPTIAFPLLQTITGAVLLNGDGFAPSATLKTVSFPSLVTLNGHFTLATNRTGFANFSAPLWLPTNGRNVTITGQALTVASVDHILARAVANAAYVTGTINLSGGTSATPSAAGLADKATLIARGVTCNTN